MPNNKYNCRFCSAILKHTFINLGVTPNANSYLTTKKLKEKESKFPLKVYICDKCLLVQLPEHQSPKKLFEDYAYFSSYSDTWLRHARDYVKMIIKRFKLKHTTSVIEIASNDGYLLQYFKRRGFHVLGIDPAENVAKVAEKKGIPTLIKFFTKNTARQIVKSGSKADLLIGNNILAHVPELNDFIKGIKTILKDEGIVTLEFPHLLKLMEENQFDTLYHEHFSYFSFLVICNIFQKHDLTVFDVDEIPTHGGSLRIYLKHKHCTKYIISRRVKELKMKEIAFGLDKLSSYKIFGYKVAKTKSDLLKFLNQAKREGKKVAGYGAPAKGNTLLNYCGIKSDLIEFTVDKNPHKQNKYLPGSYIPIYSPQKIKEKKPDYVFILPWNLKDEISEQMSFIRNWGGKFLVTIPEMRII